VALAYPVTVTNDKDRLAVCWRLFQKLHDEHAAEREKYAPAGKPFPPEKLDDFRAYQAEFELRQQQVLSEINRLKAALRESAEYDAGLTDHPVLVKAER